MTGGSVPAGAGGEAPDERSPFVDCGCVPPGSLNEPGRHVCGDPWGDVVRPVIGPRSGPTPESRHEIVRFYFSDADPVAECGCGWRAVGDSATDAFRAWWKHSYAAADSVVTGRGVPAGSRCGHTIINADGIEEPCDRPATGWRWYQDVEHEDALDVACPLHENEGGRRIAKAEAALERVREFCESGPGWKLVEINAVRVALAEPSGRST